jgi:hypothetical protein
MDCLIIDRADTPGHPGKMMLTDMATALATHGVAVTTILEEQGADDRLGEFLAAIPRDRHFFLIDGNCRANKWINDPRAIRFSFVVDHPAHRIRDFAGAKLGNLLGFVDESHLAAADRIGLPFPKIFFPHAGPPPDETMIPLAERPIDVLVSGNFAEPVTDAEWRGAHAEVPTEIADPLLEAAHRLATGLTTCIAAWEEACAVHRYDATATLTAEQLANVLVSIENLASAWRRRDVISGLADHVKMHVFTTILPRYLRDRPNIVVRGGRPFDEVQQAFRLAKVVINPVAKFAYGSHERIWYAMAAGCVVATDDSHFMRRSLAEDESFLILPWGQEQGEFRRRLVGLLHQPERLEAMQRGALSIYARHHTWGQRVLPLVDLMRQIDRSTGGRN